MLQLQKLPQILEKQSILFDHNANQPVCLYRNVWDLLNCQSILNIIIYHSSIFFYGILSSIQQTLQKVHNSFKMKPKSKKMSLIIRIRISCKFRQMAFIFEKELFEKIKVFLQFTVKKFLTQKIISTGNLCQKRQNKQKIKRSRNYKSLFVEMNSNQNQVAFFSFEIIISLPYIKLTICRQQNRSFEPKNLKSSIKLYASLV